MPTSSPAAAWLAYDIGTTGAKVAIIDAQGRTVASLIRDYPIYSREGGVMEQDALDWWQAVQHATRELLQDNPSINLSGLALTGQMQDVILVDGQGQPIHPVILYSDSRAKAEAEWVNQTLNADTLREVTGNAQDAGSLLAKLCWLNGHAPDTLQQAQYILLGAADFIAFHMTGQAVTDTTTAATTGLMDLTTTAPLSADWFTALGLADIPSRLPPMHSGGTLAGHLTAPAAASLGLPIGLPVYHGPGDAGATTLGVGSGEPGMVYGYLGTSGWIAFTATQRLSADTGVFTLAHPRQGSYIYIAPLLTAGGNLDWIAGNVGASDLSALVEAALQRLPTALLYLPYLNGERSPFRDPLARGALIGLQQRHTAEDITRAVLEGVVFAYRHCAEALLQQPPQAMTLTGGGTRSLAWCQLFADILGLTIHIAADATNVAVRGAVLAAQVAAGQAQSYAPTGRFPVSHTLTPNQPQHAYYERQYAQFRAAYPALKPLFNAMG